MTATTIWEIGATNVVVKTVHCIFCLWCFRRLRNNKFSKLFILFEVKLVKHFGILDFWFRRFAISVAISVSQLLFLFLGRRRVLLFRDVGNKVWSSDVEPVVQDITLVARKIEEKICDIFSCPFMGWRGKLIFANCCFSEVLIYQASSFSHFQIIN